MTTYVLIYLFFALCYSGAVYKHFDMGKAAKNWPTRIVLYTTILVTEGSCWPFGFAVDVFLFLMRGANTTINVHNGVSQKQDEPG